MDLALNSASIALIHETTTITIVGLQCFLCLLHIVCISVCILETRCVTPTHRASCLVPSTCQKEPRCQDLHGPLWSRPCAKAGLPSRRYYKLGEWKNMRRFRLTYLMTVFYFAILVVYFIQLTRNNPLPNSHYINTQNATYNQTWDDSMHSYFAIQKTGS
jgi:hypothetical protein